MIYLPFRGYIMGKVKFAWDRNLDYENTYSLLVRNLIAYRNRMVRGSIRALKGFTNTAILLTQLANGCRISESLEAIRIFAKTGHREVRIQVKKRKDIYKRLVVIPKEIRLTDIKYIKLVINEVKLANLKAYCKAKYGFNTHSLRYSFITYLAKKGISAQIIAKITGHSKLDFILHYTQKVKAEDILRDINNFQ